MGKTRQTANLVTDNNIFVDVNNDKVGIGTTNATSKLTVAGDVSVSGVLTASSFVGDGSGLTSITASSATSADTATSSLYATSSGIATYASTSGIATYASTAGISTHTSKWILGADGNSNYTFTGPGLSESSSDPIIYLVRGQSYQFENSMGAHPFRIQSTVNGSVGTQYNDGVTNNDVSNGILTFEVPFDAPDTLYYQCTAHASMGGKIYILDGGVIGNPIINISGENNSGVSTLTDLRLASIADKISIQSGTSANLAYNSGDGNVVYMTSATGPITLNVIGIPTTSDFDSKAISFSVFVQQGPSTAFACTSVTLNGVRFGADASPGLSTHIAYASGTVATGSTSCIDVFNFTGINTTGSASSTANYKLLGNVNGNYRLY